MVEFMRVLYHISYKIRHRILKEMLDVIHVFYSITNKPSAIKLQYANFSITSKGKNIMVKW